MLENYYESAGLQHVSIELNGLPEYWPFSDIGIARSGINTDAEGIKTEEEVSMFSELLAGITI